MGKATISAHLGEGLYAVTLDVDRTRSDKYAATLEASLSDVEAKIVAAESSVDDKMHALDEASATLQQLIVAAPTPDDAQAAVIIAARQVLIAAENALTSARGELARLRLRKVSIEKSLQGVPPGEPQAVEAWCADYSLELSGDVGTVETIRTASTPIIMPGGADGTEAAWDAGRDGQAQITKAATPASAFYNYAMAPGADKWRPRYRIGVITDLEGDTAWVNLDDATSSHQALDINVLTDVEAPVRYMSCDGAAFRVGDRVVVGFDENDWAKPVVIGFESEPKPCTEFYLVYSVPNDGTYAATFKGIVGGVAIYDAATKVSTQTADMIAFTFDVGDSYWYEHQNLHLYGDEHLIVTAQRHIPSSGLWEYTIHVNGVTIDATDVIAEYSPSQVYLDSSPDYVSAGHPGDRTVAMVRHSLSAVDGEWGDETMRYYGEINPLYITVNPSGEILNYGGLGRYQWEIFYAKIDNNGEVGYEYTGASVYGKRVLTGNGQDLSCVHYDKTLDKHVFFSVLNEYSDTVNYFTACIFDCSHENTAGESGDLDTPLYTLDISGYYMTLVDAVTFDNGKAYFAISNVPFSGSETDAKIVEWDYKNDDYNNVRSYYYTPITGEKYTSLSVYGDIIYATRTSANGTRYVDVFNKQGSYWSKDDKATLNMFGSVHGPDIIVKRQLT